MSRTRLAVAAAAFMVVSGIGASTAGADPLPDNCTRDHGTVTCVEGPGKNQGGVGTSTETQGNTTNTSPEPQDLETSCNPPKSQGLPCNP